MFMIKRGLIRVAGHSRTGTTLQRAVNYSTKPAFLLNLSGTAQGVKQEVRVDGEGHTNHIIKTDAYKVLGGDDADPDPIQYLLASITGCQQITHFLVAKDYGVTLGKSNITIESDLKPVDETPGKYSGFQTTYINIRYEVESDASDELFNTVREVTEQKCPIAQIFLNSKGLQFNSEWIKKPLP